MDLVALNSRTHRALRVSVERARTEHGAINMVGVIPHEFQHLLAHYPIFFVKSPAGQFEPAAVLGFSAGENLFVADGVWDAAYVPLQIQRQPFALIPRPPDAAAGTQASLDLALDMENPVVQTEHGERLFNEDGEASAYLKNVGSIMNALVSGSKDAHEFAGRLAELNLLEPVRVDIEFVDGSTNQLQGLYWVAAGTLKVLPADQLAALRDRRYLEWMYFQMASLAHVSGLVARKNARITRASSGARQVAPAGDGDGVAAK